MKKEEKKKLFSDFYLAKKKEKNGRKIERRKKVETKNLPKFTERLD